MASLSPCPHSPNCVSSTDPDDEDHFIPPLHYSDDQQKAKSRLQTILQAMPRTTIVEDQETYMRIECTSRIFHFIDDLEFWFKESEPLIHVRSASRVGYSDLGVNRKRVEIIRKRFTQSR